MQQNTLMNAQLKDFMANAAKYFETNAGQDIFLDDVKNFLFGPELSLDALVQEAIEESRKACMGIG